MRRPLGRLAAEPGRLRLRPVVGPGRHVARLPPWQRRKRQSLSGHLRRGAPWPATGRREARAATQRADGARGGRRSDGVRRLVTLGPADNPGGDCLVPGHDAIVRGPLAAGALAAGVSIEAAAKRCRYAAGVTPRRCVNARHIVLASPKPVRAVMSFKGSGVSSSSRRASSIRRRRTSSAGDSSRCCAAPAAERARAHPDPRRDAVHGQRLVDVLENERRDVAQPGRLLLLPLQRRAELRLIPRAPQEQHQPLRDGHRHAVPVVLFDQREGEIDPRGEPRRRPDAAVPHEDALVDDAGRGKPRAQVAEVEPVRRGAAPVEQPRLPQDEGAGADRDDRGDPPVMAAQPGDEARFPVGQRACAATRPPRSRCPEAGRRLGARGERRPRPARAASRTAGARGPTSSSS